MSADERSGWRDRALLNWHCVNNVHCRAAGVQLLMLEYNRGLPVMVIEYRRYEDGVPNTDHPIYRAIAAIAGALPFFIAYYDRGWGFCLTPLNRSARAMAAPELLTERDYVAWMHRVRGEPTKADWPRGLGNHAPASAPSQPANVPGLLLLDGATWPGEEISRHRRARLWGPDVPCVDLDYLLIDNNDATPLAVVDYKHSAAREVDWQRDTNMHAQAALAARCHLPFLVMRYWHDRPGQSRSAVDPWTFAVDGPPEERPKYPETKATGAQWLAYLRAMRQAAAA